MAELSPQAQAVLDAAVKAQYGLCYTQFEDIAAAALRAAADQVEQKLRGFSREACQEIRAIAAELRAQ